MDPTREPLYVAPDRRVSLNVRRLKVQLKNKTGEDLEKTPTKIILNDINFDLKSGNVLAILGSSGSGKTTLLNILSSRMVASDQSPFGFEGMIKYSQKDPTLSYLLQEDLFAPGLKTYEMLNYAALLKLPDSTKEERQTLIDFLLDALSLNKIRDNIISNFNGVSTLSGGEKRRVSLALQLLTKPSIIFLDEPTTGLDATTSFNLISMVKRLSVDFGITVILTIHQPRVELLSLFDNMCLLAKGGSMLYYGNLTDGVDYFDKINCMDDNFLSNTNETNFADFLLKISSVDRYSSSEVEKQTMMRLQKLIEFWRNFQKIDHVEYVDTFRNSSLVSSWFTFEPQAWFSLREISIIFKRTVLLTLRDLRSVLMLGCVMTVVAVVVGWLFVQPESDLAGIRTTTSSLYVCIEMLGFGPLNYELERLCSQDGKFLIKEYKEDKLYSLNSWFIGRRCAKLILEDIPISLIWSVITYFMWGLDKNSNFGIFFINNLIIYIVGIGLATLCFALGDYQFSFATMISGLFYQYQNSASGYFVNAKTMPVYVRWTKYIAPFWYSFGSLMSNQFTGFEGDCTGGNCAQYSGEFILETLGYSENWYAVPMVVNLVFFLAFYGSGLAIIWMKCNLGNIRIVKERKGKLPVLLPLETHHSGKELSDIKKREEVPDPFKVVLSGITLKVKPSFWGKSKGSDERILLNDLNLELRPGITAIMGPSGSGKTTMLNLVAGRSNFRSLSKEGVVKINSTVLPFNKLSMFTSYVVQDDSYLIPTLTVHETLYYQAKLRLNRARHKDIDQIIHRLIKKVGLSEVFNLPIGDHRTKGISGGEKRRLSIAIQLLNEKNRILLLDEPTSGLDSFTSQNLIKLLKTLSEDEGKVIVLTIHQPKYEIFEMFDKVVLLKDGRLVYEGDPHKLIENVHFDSQKDANFADHLMDIMVDEKYRYDLENLKNHSVIFTSLPEDESDYKSQYLEIFTQRQSFKETVLPLIERQMKVIIRTEGVLFSRVGQICGMAVIHALFFAPLKHNYDSISNRLGLIQEVVSLYFIGVWNNMALYPIEKGTFFQENSDNLYSSLEFSLIYLVNEVPIEILSSFIFSVFVVLIVGLPRTPQMFFSTWYMCTMSINCGESAGMIFSTLFEQLGIAINILSNFMTVGMFMAGTMVGNMPILFKAFNYISPLKYVVQALTQLGFSGQKFSCQSEDACLLSTGEQVLDQYNLNSTLWVNYVAIAAVTVVYRLLAYLVLRIKVSTK